MEELRKIALELLELYREAESAGIDEWCGDNYDSAKERLAAEVSDYQRRIDAACVDVK